MNKTYVIRLTDTTTRQQTNHGPFDSFKQAIDWLNEGDNREGKDVNMVSVLSPEKVNV